MDIRVLGPVEVWDGGAAVPLGGAQQRCVVGLLAAHHGAAVSLDRLSAALWEGEPPKTAKTIVQGHVSQLRKLVGDRIRSSTAGYSLAVPAEQVDLGRFRAALARGRAAARPEDAVHAWARALGQWRGQPLEGVGTAWVDQRVRVPLLEARWELLEEYAAALIELGRHAEVPGLLHELRDEQPFRETPHALTMTALWHGGRTTDAMELFRVVQRLFATELGIDPGPRLRDLHQRVLEGERPGRASVPRQLPLDVADFVGREAEADHVAGLLGDPPAIVVVTGVAGAGKSALATRVGHRVAGRFPDGQLHVDLNGYAQGDPATPERVLPRLLRALGVPAADIPASVAEQLDLYRSALAGRRVLVLLDNASSADQVRPLLPGGAACAVLVTSRDALRGLVALQGARSVTLGPLDPEAARDLLAAVVGPAHVLADPSATAEMAELCGHLPLALRIAGANLTGRPDRDVRRYVEDLHADRWSTLAVEGDPRAAVATAFGHSYAALTPDARVLFRRFGLIACRDFTARSAARLAQAHPRTAARLIGGLATAHLVEEHAPGRYRLHDLVRLYARRQATAEDEAAAARLRAYYLHTSRAVAAVLAPSIELLPLTHDDLPPDAEPISGPDAAVEWLEAEQHNLLAVIDDAAEHGGSRTAWRLVEPMRAFLDGRFPADLIGSLARRALASAQEAGDLEGQGSMHHTLANTLFVLNRPREALEEYERASARYRETGWTPGVMLTLSNLASAHANLGDFRTATGYYRQVADGWTAPSMRLATTLENHALVLHWQGRAKEARTQQERAIAMREELDTSPLWQARALSILADVHVSLGDLDRAMDLLDRSREWSERFEPGAQLAALLSSVAMIRHERGDAAGAAEAARQAVRAAVGGGLTGEHDEARSTLARVDDSIDVEERCAMLREVLASYEERTQTHLKTRIRLGLATLLLRASSHEEATKEAGIALDQAGQYGLRRLEGQARTLLARVHTGDGQPGQGLDHALRAVRLHHELGHRLDEAHALAAAADSLHALGQEEAASRARERAARLYDDTGVRPPWSRLG
ncbi:BTAD domain-containing putative transcriptional regulator [Nonomuraea africana]|uniref:DNA-binding SARP family transcriptional activator/tetratricopeptide (TPR) repeat protein n=1 Tax=Nonomuraea africana TaxID=46171 RepID=A0ABR9KVP2_9ACTN|nr:AfsR/SARP family transcriptional regulator [Nonomuraea africana]MBE1566094.1 DNA-binding SARP family transcriptional activator/tetratricopeptide (TPR) repeat protein [Nonomuraea africana]